MQAGKYLFPGGVDVHTHVDIELMGYRSVDDFYSGDCGRGVWRVVTTIGRLCLARNRPVDSGQRRSLGGGKAKDKSIIDYGIHPVILEPTRQIIDENGRRDC